MPSTLVRAQAGDPAARSALTEALRPRLVRLAHYYARRSGEDPDDLLQEAWVGCLEALAELDVRIGTPEQYLVRHARWRLLDAIRRARLRRCLPMDEGLESCLAARDLEAALEATWLEGFDAQLKASQRAVLTCLLAGLTWRETGCVLGFSSANVAYHVRQIRRLYERWRASETAFSTQWSPRDREGEASLNTAPRKGGG